MKFNYIDIENWKRKSHYQHYLKDVPCTYSMTVKLDITKIVKEKKKLYPTMLYHISKIVNSYEEFRMVLDNEGKVGYYEMMFPCYTFFIKKVRHFLTFGQNIQIVMRNFVKDIMKMLKIMEII